MSILTIFIIFKINILAWPSNINNITVINNIRLLSNGQPINITNIDNSTKTLTFSIGNKYIYTISLTNKSFHIYIKDLSDNINDLNIDGSFNPIPIFDTNPVNEYDLINLNYIGEYSLTFTSLGLETSDYIYQQNSSNIDG